MNEDLNEIGGEDFISGQSTCEANDSMEDGLWRYVGYLGGGLAVIGALYAILSQ